MNAPPNNALQSDAPSLNRGVRTWMAYARKIFYVAVVILALAGSLLFTYGCDGPGCLGFVGSVLMWALAYTVVLGYGLLLLFISAFTNANRVFSAVVRFAHSAPLDAGVRHDGSRKLSRWSKSEQNVSLQPLS